MSDTLTHFLRNGGAFFVFFSSPSRLLRALRLCSHLLVSSFLPILSLSCVPFFSPIEHVGLCAPDWSTDDSTPAAKDGQGETPVALIGGVVAIACVFVLIYFLSQ
jgi:hypothetical protein